MKKLYTLTVGTLLAMASFAQVSMSYVSTYSTGEFNASAAEIVTYDSTSQTLVFSKSSTNSIEFLDFADPTNLTNATSVDMSSYGGSVNSVASHNGVVAVAVEANVKQDNGVVVFFDMTGNFISQVTVGALPDMVTYSPDGTMVLSANEGEPNDDWSNDPDGSVSIIDVSAGEANVTQADVTTLDFNNVTLTGDVRIFGPSPVDTAANIEPEYITISSGSNYAYVSLQENNAVAVIDLNAKAYLMVMGLGYKDHSIAGNGMDASDKDDMINIVKQPVYGMYQPDAIKYFDAGGVGYVISANEGDARDYDAYAEEERVKDLNLDTVVFANYDSLQEDEALGRLTVTTTLGDTDGDGYYEELYAFGARSFSIWNGVTGSLVYDSGDDFEQKTAAAYPEDFNANNDENDSFESRSDNKGPEPEAVEVFYNDDKIYALIGLERMGGIMLYEITNPSAPVFIQYINNRDFSVVDAELNGSTNDSIGDLGVEDLKFINDTESPDGKFYVVSSNEVSGTVSVFEITGLVSTVGINDVYVDGVKWEVYPNPTSSVLKTNIVDSYMVYDLSGKEVASFSNTQVMDLSNLNKGMYIVRNSEGAVTKVNKL